MQRLYEAVGPGRGGGYLGGVNQAKELEGVLALAVGVFGFAVAGGFGKRSVELWLGHGFGCAAAGCGQGVFFEALSKIGFERCTVCK